MGDIFDDVMNSGEAANRMPHLEQTLENSVMKTLLSHFKLSKVANELSSQSYARTGKRIISFAAFHQHFPEFPVWLVPIRLLELHRIQLWDFLSFAKCRKTKLFCAFEGEAENVDGQWLEMGRPYGIVFRKTHTEAGGTLWILHNASSEVEWGDHFRLTLGDQVIAIQSFKQFLEQVRWEI